MAKEREYFIDGMTDEAGNVVIDGAVRRGVPRAVAEKIFDEMSAFASYAFNKSHAAAYAMVAVQTAWLKRHYPVPFMAATLNSMMDNADKVAGYIQYCRQNGIPVLKPDVNKSVWRFSVDTDENGTPGIRFGLGGVKNVGHGAVELIEKERAHGAFASIFDFAERVSGEMLNKRTVESLIKAGAFDGLGLNRAQLLSVYERLMDDAAQKRRQNVAGQMSLFDMGAGGRRALGHNVRCAAHGGTSAQGAFEHGAGNDGRVHHRPSAGRGGGSASLGLYHRSRRARNGRGRGARRRL